MPKSDPQIGVYADPPIMTTSERASLKRCPQRWWWEYRDGLRTTEVQKAYWFGIGIHLALARYYGNIGYKRNMDFIDVWRTYCDEDEISLVLKAAPDGFSEDESWVDAKALGESMLLGYHDLYQGDPDWDMIHVEMPFQIGIPDPADPDSDICIFNSTFDGVYRHKHDRKIRLQEHKTAKAITTDHLPLDPQAGAYWAVASIVLKHEGILSGKQRIDGITYNFLRKALPDTRPKNAEGYATNNPIKQHYIDAINAAGGDADAKQTLASLQADAATLRLRVVGDVSKNQPPPLYQRDNVNRVPAERATQIDRIAGEAMLARAYDTGLLPLVKNTTRDCSWDCQFFNMCQLHEQQADWVDFRDAVFMKRDPYDRYRLLKSA
jgi:diadenosine tetraphosphatase ApaH/serine/threonine PP2A family protein phosphatase